jgi:hypothetical protein
MAGQGFLMGQQVVYLELVDQEFSLGESVFRTTIIRYSLCELVEYEQVSGNLVS